MKAISCYNKLIIINLLYAANSSLLTRGSHGSVVMSEKEATAALDKVVERVRKIRVLFKFSQCPVLF